ILLAHAMKRVGDVGELWRQTCLWTVATRILQTPSFLLGVLMMAVGFYSLLFALSWADVSLVGPASASLTFVGNSYGAKFFLSRVAQSPPLDGGSVCSGGRCPARGLSYPNKRINPEGGRSGTKNAAVFCPAARAIH